MSTVIEQRNATLLGNLGLVPLFVLAIALWLPWSGAIALRIQFALVGYTSVVLSFLGAVHWGLALANPGLDKPKAWNALGWGVIPSYPVFYLNLGRAYIAANKKKDAIDALKKGLKYDSSHSDLMKELKDLGVRKSPPVPFLARSNPINKYIGMILHTTTVAKGAGRGAGGRRGPSR